MRAKKLVSRVREDEEAQRGDHWLHEDITTYPWGWRGPFRASFPLVRREGGTSGGIAKYTFHMVANQKLQLRHLPGCAPLGHHERRQGMRDIDYLVDLVHSIANRRNELTEQHVKEVAELQERVARLERNDAARGGATYVAGHEVLR